MQLHLKLTWPTAIVLLSSVLLTGCAQMPTVMQGAEQRTAQAENGLAVSEELAEFLAQAPEQGVEFFSQTPWGADKEIHIQQRYFAASGRDCVKLAVDTQQEIQRVCQSGQGWQQVSPVVP